MSDNYFSHEQILDLKNKLDYRKYYRQFLQLSGYGEWLRAQCPFHDDKNPSFYIHEKSGIWHCKSNTKCGSGDVIDFHQKITGKDFVTSVMEIAESQNIKIEISEEYKKELEEKKAIHKINNFVANLYTKALSQSKDGQQYIISRNFDIETIKKFKLGYIPNYELKNIANGIEPLLYFSGLIKKDYKNNTYVNYFSNRRISIPFMDEYGNIVGFSSRVIDKDIKPKYLHTRTNKFFDMQDLLFGYNFAKNKIKDTKSVILVEGQCFKGDTEILTPEGWIRFDKYSGQNVMQVDKNMNGEFVKPIAIINKEYNDYIYSVNNRNYSIEATKDHNIVYIQRGGKLIKKEIQDMPKAVNGIIPMAIKHNGVGLQFTDDELRLMVAISADGSAKDTAMGTDKHVRIMFKKQRKVERLESLLKSCNIKYVKTNPKARPDFTYFGFRYKHSFKLFPQDWIEKSTHHQKEVILKELKHWDACDIKNRNQTEFVSCYYYNATFIQTLAHLYGCNATIYKKEDSLGLRWRVNILWGKNSASWQQGTKKELYSGKVYCVTVPTGMILVRCKDRISVVGNCDTIRAHQYGIENCVAMCGLKISEKQLKLLQGVSNFYIVIEDSHTEDALDRLYEQITSVDYYANVKIINLEQNKEKCDLDEFLIKYGKGAFLEKIKNAHTYNEHKLIDSINEITYKNIEEKKKYIYINKKYICGIKNLIDRNQYIELLAEKLELPENDIRRIISKAEVQENIVNVPYDENIDNRPHVSQSYIIATFFANNFTISQIYEAMSNLKIKNKLKGEFKRIFDKICDTILTFGNKCDIINIIHTQNILNKSELLVLDEAFFRHDDLDYLEDEYELSEFLKDQLNNLR